MRQRVVRDQRSDVRQLGGFGLQEFAARRDVEEQIAHADRSSQRQPGLFDRQDLASGNFDDGSSGVFRGMRLQAQAADGGDGGQRFSAKAQGRDVQQVVGVADFRGGVTLEGQHGVVAHHAAAVVDHLDQLAASGLNVHANAAGTGIERVLQQLLRHRRRALDHLARGDLVGYIFGENVDATHRVLRYMSEGKFQASSFNEKAGSFDSRRSLRMTEQSNALRFDSCWFLFRPAEPRVLPGERDVLVIAAEANVGAVAVGNLDRLVLGYGNETVAPMRELVCLVSRLRMLLTAVMPPHQKLPSSEAQPLRPSKPLTSGCRSSSGPRGCQWAPPSAAAEPECCRTPDWSCKTTLRHNHRGSRCPNAASSRIRA